MIESNSTELIVWSLSMLGTSDQLNQVGSIALWVGVIENAFSTLGFIILAQKAKRETLMFYYINILICALSVYCYLLMAMREGDYVNPHGYLVFWPRYLEFTLGTPLLLIDLGIIAGADMAELVFIITCDVLMMWTGWSATIAIHDNTKWVMFGLSCLFFAPVLSTLLGSMRKDAQTKSVQVRRLYDFLSMYTVIIWCGYPLIWLLYDGFYLIDINTESVIHTILDLFAKDLFGFILIYNHDLFESHDTSVITVVDTTAKPSDDDELPTKNTIIVPPYPPLPMNWTTNT